MSRGWPGVGSTLAGWGGHPHMGVGEGGPGQVRKVPHSGSTWRWGGQRSRRVTVECQRLYRGKRVPTTEWGTAKIGG